MEDRNSPSAAKGNGSIQILLSQSFNGGNPGVKQKNTVHPEIQMLPVNHSYVSSGVTILTGAASTLGKVNGLKLQVNTYFGK
jgi:hypothetical protein